MLQRWVRVLFKVSKLPPCGERKRRESSCWSGIWDGPTTAIYSHKQDQYKNQRNGSILHENSASTSCPKSKEASINREIENEMSHRKNMHFPALFWSRSTIQIHLILSLSLFLSLFLALSLCISLLYLSITYPSRCCDAFAFSDGLGEARRDVLFRIPLSCSDKLKAIQGYIVARTQLCICALSETNLQSSQDSIDLVDKSQNAWQSACTVQKSCQRAQQVSEQVSRAGHSYCK